VSALRGFDALIDALGGCPTRWRCSHGADVRCEGDSGHPGPHWANCPDGSVSWWHSADVKVVAFIEHAEADALKGDAGAEPLARERNDVDREPA